MKTALFALLLTAATARAADRPNVIVVLTDDQGYGDLSCHGHPTFQTPNLDRLHGQSVRLTDFHVCPMCTPTRGQLLTGQDCLRNGAMNVSSGRTMLRRGIPTLADWFTAAGFRARLFGKWHLGDNYPYRPQDRGFASALWFPSSHIGSAPDFWNNDYFDDTYLRNDKRERVEGYCTDVFFNEAMSWMRDCAANQKPFFCYLATNTPHAPLFVAPNSRKNFTGTLTPEQVRFFGMLSNIDDNMGRLDRFLTESGLAENTILVFLTDNGGTLGVPIFNAGMRGRKTELWDGGHRVPCFIRWPRGGFVAPTDLGELTTVQDLAPTLCELATVPPAQAAFDGLSLVPLLRGERTTLPDRKVVIQFSRMNRQRPFRGDGCVMWKRWRLIAGQELYNLATDPEQQINVIDQHPEVATSLRQHYETWWSGVEQTLDEFEHIIIGADAENPLRLSPADWADVFLDQGSQVRAGTHKNGTWHLEVAQDGEYEFALRRWATETDAPLVAGLPAHQHTTGTFPAGVPLPIAHATLTVGEHTAREPVAATATVVRFTVPLKAGRTKLRTAFLDADSNEICGAYFVTVHRK